MGEKTTTTKRLLRLSDKQYFSEYVRSLAWSPQGDLLSIITAGGELALWQAGNISLLQVNNGYSLDCLGFSADGQWLATGGQEGKVKIWRLAAGQQTFGLLATLDFGKAWLDSLVWHPQQNLLAFGVNRQIKIWDAESQTIIANLDFEASSVFSLAWNPQGNLLAASGHGGVKVWHGSNWMQKPDRLEVPEPFFDVLIYDFANFLTDD